MTNESRPGQQGRPLRIGFLGAGLIATYHSKSLRRSGAEARSRASSAPGCSTPTRPAPRRSLPPPGTRCARSEDEVLDGCDAVYICTWTSEHPRQLAKAAERGLAVFCEKPLAITTELAETMEATVAAAGLTNQVGLVLRRSAAYNWAKHLIDDPAAGRVMTVVFRDDQFIPIQGHYASTWRADRTLVGAGTLLEHSIHDVDMLRFLVGDVVRVERQHGQLPRPRRHRGRRQRHAGLRAVARSGRSPACGTTTSPAPACAASRSSASVATS